MEVKNTFTVPEPQTDKNHEAPDPVGTPSAASTEAGKGDGVSFPFPRDPQAPEKPALKLGCPPPPPPAISLSQCPFPPRFPSPALLRAPRQTAHSKGPTGSAAAITSSGDRAAEGVSFTFCFLAAIISIGFLWCGFPSFASSSFTASWCLLSGRHGQGASERRGEK